MRINIPDPVFQTTLFTIIFAFFVVLTVRKDAKPHELDHGHTDELKGLAILMVLFSHIGYFLSTDDRFLFPLSIAAGIGVNIFLFLSGFGLASSELRSKKTVKEFYTKRLKNIFVPMWLVLFLVLVLDYLLLGKAYEFTFIVKSTLGFFSVADISTSLNSPLWYFTFILFYYLTFPIIFRKDKPLVSAGLMMLLGFLFTKLNLPVTVDVLKLYQTHYLLFPLGMAFAVLNEKKPGIKFRNILEKISPNPTLTVVIRYVLVGLLVTAFGYIAVHSGVGKGVMKEQLPSIAAVFILVLIFLLKDVHSKLLMVFGTYSYEIYLTQWPLMYRYDFIYKYTPAFLGTLLYLVFFISIGFVLSRIARFLTRPV